jgi:hypothetical protein
MMHMRYPLLSHSKHHQQKINRRLQHAPSFKRKTTVHTSNNGAMPPSAPAPTSVPANAIIMELQPRLPTAG